MKKPIIHAYFICYNEEYILPHLLKYYLGFCEKIVIIDNMSTDNSRAIINSFPNTEIISYNSKGKFDDNKHKNIKIPNTTNTLDGGTFSPLKILIKIHRRFSKNLKLKLVDDYLLNYKKK